MSEAELCFKSVADTLVDEIVSTVDHLGKPLQAVLPHAKEMIPIRNAVIALFENRELR